jgi:chromate transporter
MDQNCLIDRPDAQGSIGELARLFTRLGFTAFGGPAAHISMIHDEVVTRRSWLDDQRFLDLIGVTNLIPGPNSTEMTMHVGHQRAGWPGLIVSGVCFIVPAALIVLVLAWAYVEFGDTPNGEALLYGIKPVVIVIIAQALIRLGGTAVKGWSTGLIGVAAAIAYLIGINELAILALGGIIVVAMRSVGTVQLMSAIPVWGMGSFAVAAPGSDPLSLGRLFLVFLKAGAFLYGSGYVLLAFLHGDLVERFQVLTEQQLLDAISIGQVTPGPVLTTATFIGYVLGGFPGAAVATIGIFLPAFLFVGAVTPLVRRIRDRVWTASLLDGVNAAALGLMAGVTLQLSQDALVDPLTVGIGLVAAALVWRTRLNSTWLVIGGGVAGLVASLPG